MRALILNCTLKSSPEPSNTEALLNVVSNAAEACAANPGDVIVRVRAILAPGGTAPLVEIVVTDTGPGIPRAHLGRLFVPGFTTKETGSGLTRS